MPGEPQKEMLYCIVFHNQSKVRAEVGGKEVSKTDLEVVFGLIQTREREREREKETTEKRSFR